MIKKCDLHSCNHRILGNDVYTLQITLFGNFKEGKGELGSSMPVKQLFYHSKECMLTGLDMAQNNVDKRISVTKKTNITDRIIHVDAVLVENGFSIKGLTA